MTKGSSPGQNTAHALPSLGRHIPPSAAPPFFLSYPRRKQHHLQWAELPRNKLRILQPEKEQIPPPSSPVLAHLDSTLVSPGELEKNPDTQDVPGLIKSESLGAKDQVLVFSKTGPSTIHTKVRPTIDYTSLSGLTEEKTDYE